MSAYTVVFVYEDGTHQSGVSHEDEGSPAAAIEATKAGIASGSGAPIGIVAVFEGHHMDQSDTLRDWE